MLTRLDELSNSGFRRVNILKLALKDIRNTFAVTSSCKSVRFRKSSCQRCLEVCPEEAISLNPGPSISSNCSDCGLCLNACPTEAFQNGRHLDRALLNRAESLLSRDQPRNGRKRLLIHCRQAEPGNRNSLPTSCLGEITENSILGAAILGFDEVALARGNCSQCRFKYGEKLLAKSMATARALLSGLGLEEITLRLIEKDRRNSQVMNRRAIFSRISGRMQTEAESDSKEHKIQRQLSGTLKDHGGAWHSPKKDHLRELLERNGKTNLVVKYNPELPGGRLRIDAAKCSGCELCSNLCPTSAISADNEGTHKLFYFVGSSCPNCSLCKEACPEAALDFEDCLNLQDLVRDDKRLVARVQLASCIVCGGNIKAGGSKLCPTCRKRQVSSLLIASARVRSSSSTGDAALTGSDSSKTGA